MELKKGGRRKEEGGRRKEEGGGNSLVESDSVRRLVAIKRRRKARGAHLHTTGL